MTGKKNLFLISLDTLRADVAYSGKFPTIEALRARGTSFLTTVSSSPLTPISHATVLSGLQPPRHGIRHLLREQLEPEVETLATILGEAGYQSGAVVSCPGMSEWYGFHKGFDSWDDWIPPLADGRNALDVIDVELRGTALKRAPMVVERALEWVDHRDQDQPFVLFTHFFDSHWPYEAPEDYGVDIANPYEGEVAYMDHHLGELIKGLEERGIDDSNTLTVLFSDHGEDLAGWYPDDHGGELGHPEEKGHGCLLYDVTQLVPLIFAGAGIGEGVDVEAQVRLVDICSTILDELGVDVPSGLDGETIAPALRGDSIQSRPAYCEAYYREELAQSDPQWAHLVPLKATRTEPQKVIWETPGDRVDLYDLVQDPAERNPITVVPGSDGPS